MKVYLVRHGQTDWNNEFRLQGSKDIELNKTGIEQAEKVGARLANSNIKKIYSSNLKRALKTAEVINKYINTDIIIKEDIQEMNLGEWEGKRWGDIQIEYAEYLKRWFEHIDRCPSPGGESYNDLKKRAFSVMNEIVKNELEAEEVLIVSHGAVIKTILCSILNLDLKNRGNFEIHNGSLSVVEYSIEKGVFRVLSINDVSHFEVDKFDRYEAV